MFVIVVGDDNDDYERRCYGAVVTVMEKPRSVGRQTDKVTVGVVKGRFLGPWRVRVQPGVLSKGSAVADW